MSRAYENFRKRLEKHKCILLTTLNDWNNSDSICYKCENGHISNVAKSSTRNRFLQAEKKNIIFCGQCSICSNRDTRIDVKAKELGIIQYQVLDKKYMKYTCQCGIVNKCLIDHFVKNKKSNKCLNLSFIYF